MPTYEVCGTGALYLGFATIVEAANEQEAVRIAKEGWNSRFYAEVQRSGMSLEIVPDAKIENNLDIEATSVERIDGEDEPEEKEYVYSVDLHVVVSITTPPDDPRLLYHLADNAYDLLSEVGIKDIANDVISKHKLIEERNP